MADFGEDEDEVRLRQRHIKAALSTKHLDRGYKAATPAALEAHAMRQATRLNLVFRRRPGWAAGARFAIAGPARSSAARFEARASITGGAADA